MVLVSVASERTFWLGREAVVVIDVAVVVLERETFRRRFQTISGVEGVSRV